MPRPRTNKISNNNSDEPVTKIARHSTRGNAEKYKLLFECSLMFFSFFIQFS